MQHDSTESAAREFSLGQAALADGDTLTALVCFERALKQQDQPAWYSYLGYCVAKERGQHRKGLELSLSSLEIEPGNPIHFLHLALIHVLTGDREAALQAARTGMAAGGTPELAEMVERLGARKPPVFPSLPRDNPLNKYLGMFLARLGLR